MINPAALNVITAIYPPAPHAVTLSIIGVSFQGGFPKQGSSLETKNDIHPCPEGRNPELPRTMPDQLHG